MATLTEVQGVNYALKNSVPSEKLDVSQNLGRVRVLYDEYSVDAADQFGTSGLIRLFTIPKGARLLLFKAYAPASGATGAGTIGWAASSDGSEAADADGIMAAAEFDPGNAAIEGLEMLQSAAGFNKRFDSEVEVQVDITEATADAGGDTWKFMALIAVD